MSLKWVHHDGIGYIFLEPTTATVCAQTQQGNWHQVHSRESARAVERDVFSLWIDHGSKPHDARYAYLVVPDVDVSALPSLCNSLPVTILQQTASTVAIASQDGKLVQAVFFEPGRLAWGNGSIRRSRCPLLSDARQHNGRDSSVRGRSDPHPQDDHAAARRPILRPCDQGRRATKDKPN